MIQQAQFQLSSFDVSLSWFILFCTLISAQVLHFSICPGFGTGAVRTLVGDLFITGFCSLGDTVGHQLPARGNTTELGVDRADLQLTHGPYETPDTI